MKNRSRALRLSFISLALALASGTAQAAKDPKEVPSPQRMVAGDLRVFDGNDCFGSGGNCLPEVIVYGFALHTSALRAFDAAVTGGKTKAYFGSERWHYLLPALKLHPRQLAALQSGVPLIRVDRPNGRRFYVASRTPRNQLLRLIERSQRGRAIPGVEVCIPVTIKK